MKDKKSNGALNGIRDHPIFPLLTVNFIGTLGISLVLPFLVFLVERFGGNALIYGIISSTYPVFQLIGGPLLGRWSDIYGRKKILFLSQLGTFISWLIFVAALLIPLKVIMNVESPLLGSFVITVPLVLLFIARGFDGLTGGNVAVANAYLADITSDEDRSKNFGKMSISSNIGFVIGPSLAGLLSLSIYGDLLPVLAAVLISFTGLLVIARFIPESVGQAVEPCVENMDLAKTDALAGEIIECSSAPKKMNFKIVFKLDHIPYMFVMYFLLFLGFNMFYACFPLHAIDNLGWEIADMGIFFSVLSLMMVFVQGPVLTKASGKYRDVVLVIAGSLLLATNFLLYIPSDTILTYAGAVFFALGNGLMWPSLMSVLSKLAGNENQGVVQGVSTSVMSLASIAGLLSGGFLYGLFAEYTFIIAAVFIYIVFIMSIRVLSYSSLKTKTGF